MLRPFSVLFLLVAFIAPLPAQQTPAADNTQPPAVTLETIFADGGLTGRQPETVRWSPDGSRLTYLLRDAAGERGEMWSVDTQTGKAEVMIAADKFGTLTTPQSAVRDERQREWLSRYAVAGYHWAPGSRHMLFDARGQLWLYSLGTGTAVQLTSGAPATDPKFSPDGKRVAFVREHNLYVQAVNSTREEPLTRDGNENILNGEVDWVYAEELDVRSNYFWSPEGKQIAYLQMNQENVPTYPIVDWIPAHASVDNMKYPKAGDPNPVVRLGVVDSGGGRTRWIELTKDADIYMPRFGWVREGILWAQVLNRAQDRLDLYFIDTNNGRSRLVLTETSPDAWVEVSNDFRILKSGGRFLWTSWRDGHTHIYLYAFDANAPLAAEAKLERQLTRGQFEVFSVDGVDEATGTVFFTANSEDARQRHIYSVKLDGTGMARLTSDDGSHAANFSPNGDAFIDTYSGLMTPPQLRLCRPLAPCTTFFRSKGIDEFKLARPQFVDFKADDGTVLYGTLFLPTNTERRSVPVILYPYGGPGSQQSRNVWGGDRFLFHQLMLRRGYAVLTVDNRGMAARGRKFAAASRRNFGEVELRDQLASLDQALARFPQLDPDRVGFWGWSYGGYMTLYAMTHSDRFKAGVSVAPVANWLDYDTIYTERYMGLPRDNGDAYKKSSPVHDAANLKGDLLLVHGTSDDNVHVQNSIQMTDALIAAGKQFRLMLYPRKTHGIAGRAARLHLFTSMIEHFERTLGTPAAKAAKGNTTGQ